MFRKRIIPCLLLQNEGLVKTVQFKKPTYIGDPLNAIRIFNQKEVDELIFLDIDATRQKREPNYAYLSKIADQCFMPLCYGGGITTIEQIHKIFSIGFEKVSINASAYSNPELINEAIARFGAQSIVASMDVWKDHSGHRTVKLVNGRMNTKKSPVEYAEYLEGLGVGEILVNDISNDGIMQGYDTNMIKEIVDKVQVPVIACGGAGSLYDCIDIMQLGAGAAAAGSIFVYWGRLKGILINYPSDMEIQKAMSKI